jgi:hypothetical protein
VRTAILDLELGRLKGLYSKSSYAFRMMKKMVYFEAYLDDSADSGHDRFQAAGGLFTHELRWARFKIAWQRATEHLDAPFHATDCECGHGQFKSWNKPERDALMKELSQLINDFDFGVFGSAVSINEFRQVFPNAHEDQPYLLCLGMCIAHIAEVTRLGNAMLPSRGMAPCAVRFYVERRKATEGREKALYSEIREATKFWRPPLITGEGLLHRGKEDRGLQAADLFAREVYKFRANEGIRSIRKPLNTVARQITFTVWSIDSLNELKALSQQCSFGKSLAIMAQRSTSTPAQPLQSRPDWPHTGDR